MDGRAVALAIPLFFFLIGIELIVDRRRRNRKEDPLYRFGDSISSLSCGIGQQVLQVVALTALGVVTYGFAYDNFRLFSIPKNAVWGWAVAFVLVDLCYWVYHWASHRVNFFWAMHVVHHSSEEYNLSTALRQSWFTNLTSWVFYLPVAIAGVPPEVFLLCLTLNILYQFWIHTRAIGTLGPAELVLNTPSHHRVHHGIDPEYIDKNYGGVFIVWDRLFRTFTKETLEPSYGTVKGLGSFNPFWANVDLFVHLAQLSQKTKRWSDKILVWVKPPEWHPEDLGGVVTVPAVDKAARLKYRAPGESKATAYVCFQFALVAVMVFVLLWFAAGLGYAALTVGALLVLAALGVWSGLLEHKRWAMPVEAIRLVGLGAVGVYYAVVHGGLVVGALVVASSVVSAAWLLVMSRSRAAGPVGAPA